MAVPLQTPVVIVPTLVKLELTRLLAKVVPVKVFASAAMVISALPSNATPLIFFVAANFVAVEALPVKGPLNPVALMVPLVNKLVTLEFLFVLMLLFFVLQPLQRLLKLALALHLEL